MAIKIMFAGKEIKLPNNTDVKINHEIFKRVHDEYISTYPVTLKVSLRKVGKHPAHVASYNAPLPKTFTVTGERCPECGGRMILNKRFEECGERHCEYVKNVRNSR